ncbi:hypothetical protein CVV68_21820 [Arthrobacter livingstonensis]|uniref:Uncharacterized protein n=1 Tax=Arthrobacter livingstonensis TaxID=670078 RepID=A0A2V5KZY6_9MICC|nr:hypothetical protein [Arthrobacter livingstonensis]PYI64491.1 hypothetical protein CVV68_21820 [Arthrobacter livingstonensis]
MTKTGSQDTEGQAEKAAHAKKDLGLSPVQVIAGGGAAAVASVIGGHIGLAGTVVGAFLLSVVSGIALPLIRASLEKSHEQIKRVVPRRTTETARTTLPHMAADTTSIVRATSHKVSATHVPLEQPWESMADARQRPREATTGRKIRMAIGGTAAIFIIGLGSILGIQAATGVSLSHGTSVLQSGIAQVVAPASHRKDTPRTDLKPKGPAVEPSTVPTDPATDPALAPAEQPAVAPTPTSDPSPSADPTTPTGTDTPAPSSTPDPATGLSNGNSGAGTSGSQAQPSPAPSAAAPAQ